IGYNYRNGRAETPQEHAARVRAEYDAQPWYEQAATAADDIITHHVANPFGLGDHVRAAASTLYNGGPYAEHLARERAETRDAGIRAGTAGIAAGMVTPLKAATSGLTLAGRFGTAALTKAQGLAARTGLMAAEGAFCGGADAAGRGHDMARGATLGAAGGAIGNVAGEALSAGVNAVARNFAPQGTRATADALRETAEAAYQRADTAGVTFAPTD